MALGDGQPEPLEAQINFVPFLNRFVPFMNVFYKVLPLNLHCLIERDSLTGCRFDLDPDY